MTDQISAKSVTAGAAHPKSDALAGSADAAGHAGDAAGQARAVAAIRAQFNPLGAGLRSIWPQSVVGF
ncbi:hypothetical protein [Arthrobacter sp. EpRS71]|uniref:hypothetical protein n=1 Tax=Arthrobacter sp. EpRS71 TaxID=1743141 RepID=UPI000747BBCE|nr:hypothetical protein [Arthrobacter sp. EpRS71]KUM35821.1 hypothetical protein AR689_17755 [Arthrobacter sp. EpRS71]